MLGLDKKSPAFRLSFPGGRIRSMRRRRSARPETPCLTYNPTKPGWLLATVKGYSLALFLDAHSWDVRFLCGRAQDARGSIKRTHGEA